PPRRLGALVLIRDQDGRVLLVNPTYRAGWQLPGGAAHAGESIGTAAARELAEETGLTREITHALAVDQMPRNTETGSTEGLNVVCDGGRLTADEAAVVAVPDSATGELTGLRWVPLDQLGEITLPYQERRIRQAVSAAVLGNRLPLLKAGEPSA
ncbi:NUDIX domain-containing protein, partial [Saccharothrix sp. ST-888]|uniref:NUDIX domain-containing protein n=1 Tax=Saccharothrix sp. ST-888 TaxID=1427391 RepID=UPI000698E045